MDACSGGLPAAPVESLFSLELVVDCVQVLGAAAPGPAEPPSRLLAVAFRLLDFPTVLVHQVEPESAEEIRRGLEWEKENAAHAPQLRDRLGNFTFTKGKSCLFKISLASLHSHLTHTPLYAMLLDVFPHLPKLVGSCLISLGETIEKVRQDVERHGIAVPCVHGGKGVHNLCNLMGEKVGYISVGHRLLSLGASLLPHIPQKEVLKVGVRNENVSVHTPACSNQPRSVGHQCEACEKIPAHSLKEPDSVHNGNILVQHLELGNTEVPIVISELAENHRLCKLSTSTQHTVRKLPINQEIEQHRDVYDIADNVFCPPPLYYNQSAEEPEGKYTQMYRIVEHQAECLPSENNSDEDDGLKTDNLFRMSQTSTHSSVPQDQTEKTSRINSQIQGRQLQSDIGNTIRQLPLLNALLLELSLLNDQALPQIPLPIHPQLAWLYRETKDDFPVFDQVAKSKTQHPKSSTPISSRYTERYPKEKMSPKYKEKTPKQDKIVAKIGLEHRKNKLIYGLTNTLRLRLQKTNPNFLMLHEQKELLRKRQVEQLKERTKGTRCKSNNERSSSKPHQLDTGGGQISLQSAFKNKGETLIQARVEQDSPNSSKLSRNVKFSDRNDDRHIAEDVNVCLPTTCPHDAGYIGNETNNKDVDIFQTQECIHDFPTNDSPEDGVIETSCSYHSSPEPRYSEDFSINLEATEYSEDFGSPEPTSKYEDTLGSSTESTVKHTNSTSESKSYVSEHSNYSQRGASENTGELFPLPESSEKSPILALKGTYIVKGRHRRPSLSSALSDTSDDSIISSMQSRFKKPIKSTIKPQNYMIEDNPTSSESPQFSDSRNRHRTSEEGHSVGTSQVSSYIPSNVSDFDLSAHEMTPADLQEDGDEPVTATMEIANKCKHISELIANKLPGYTV